MPDDLSRLEAFQLQGVNLRAACSNCQHAGILDGHALWRWFAIHRWRTELAVVGEHMRCSICRRRPASLNATTDPPTLHPFPRDEAGWQRVIRRVRD